MPKHLVQRIRVDSVAEFEAAAVARFQDGLELDSAGCSLAAIYLWGYAAEMTLKAAYFRLIGFAASRRIFPADLKSGRDRAIQLGVVWPQQNLHNLIGWAELIVLERRQLGVPLAPQLVSRHMAASITVQLTWRETLRYHNNRAYAFEVRRVVQGVEWLLANYAALWR